jgi:cyclopropane fatty-acyl-phospholipid synthase-like methyltransferase
MKKVEIFNKDGVDTGWIGNNQRWWFDINHTDSFELFDLDSFYSDVYFKNDHISNQAVYNYVYYITEYYKQLTGKPISSVLEAGCAGGWFTKKFIENGIDVIALEGSKSGVDASLLRGIPSDVIIRHDLRKEIKLNRKFDIVCCTEVAEHIETPFSSQLIKTLTEHSDIVWFSFEEPGTNLAHYHHCNEQPAKFWINLFDFYGYGCLELPNEINLKCEWRAKYIFYNKTTIKI